MIKQLRYDFYRIVMPNGSGVDFGTALSQINALNGKVRVDETGEYPIRLHSLFPGAVYVLGDIARIRMNDIPPKMRLSGETELLYLDEDQGLGEITSFIYHPGLSVLMMMRNRNAVSAFGLCHYVENKCNLWGIKIEHILQAEAYKRIQRLERIQRLDLEVAAPGNGSIFNELKLIPETAIDLMGKSPRVRLSLSFSTGYDRDVSLPKKLIEKIVTAFHAIKVQPSDESVSLTVSGRENVFEKEVIDLFEDVFTDLLDVNIKNQRRITDDQRHQATRIVWDKNRDMLVQLLAQT
jgi:hypothetical protein